MFVVFVFFFFSSRRRHTRFDCDWSSDVCSSDLRETAAVIRPSENQTVQGMKNLKICALTYHGSGRGSAGSMRATSFNQVRQTPGYFASIMRGQGSATQRKRMVPATTGSRGDR